jgi:hypothetical protein
MDGMKHETLDPSVVFFNSYSTTTDGSEMPFRHSPRNLHRQFPRDAVDALHVARGLAIPLALAQSLNVNSRYGDFLCSGPSET